ncbi:neurexin-1-like isoform X2 [Brachionus plicatilis]|uniref:Neurexin-1-like isoform X2 n=1 Tax=Brachionus plicatilis TaxID=10195 RepID=A0A3M7RJN9_BRAPC|nr:neurexin-1-like isoform X2 [Brachionus plicatilis]
MKNLRENDDNNRIEDKEAELVLRSSQDEDEDNDAELVSRSSQTNASTFKIIKAIEVKEVSTQTESSPFIDSPINKISKNGNLDLQEQTYRLIGSHNTYAQYLPWYPCLNSSIIFEFKTHEPNGLLLYSQSLPYKYIQISLVDGNIRLRMRIGEKDNPRGIFLVYDTSQLNDEKWHEVRFVRNNEKTILSVDGKKFYHIHQESILSDLMFGQPDSNEQTNSLFIGGLPDTLQTYNLSHGTVLFEPIFNGFIRNVRAVNCSSPFLKPLEVDSYTNLRFVVESGSCSSNPCLNNGVCLITSGSSVAFKCDCTYTNFEGDLCEIVRPPISNQELTLNGKDYFMVEIPVSEEDLTPAILPSYEVEFNVEFKTSRSTGLLIYAGDVSDYFVLGLQDGAIFYKLNIRGEVIEKSLAIPGTYLNNNHWHSVKFTRKFRSIQIVIDDLKKDESNLAGQFMSMSNKFVYVGGVPKKNTIYRAIYKNFIGCIRNVTYKSDTSSLNLISLLLNNSHLVKENGKIERTCQQVMQPITFSSPNSYIPILEWTNYPLINSFTIEFQTNEKNAVLAYILGAENFQHRAHIDHLMRSRLLSLNRHFFSLEIHNSFLNAYFNLGTNYIRHEVVHVQISDGRSHQLTVELNQQYAIFKFDQNPETSIRISSSDSDLLELQSPLVIGGIHPNHRSLSGHSPSTRVPPYFYSAMLGNGYVGCILDLDINGQSVNLTYFAGLEGVSGVNSDVCSPMPNQCDIGQCLNEGICIEGWNRFECDCSSTGFNGPICNQRKYKIYQNLNADY